MSMPDPRDGYSGESTLARGLQAVTTLAAVAFILVADYPPLALGALVAMFFAAYIWLRMMIYFENDRFSPKRLRVGVTWALVGIASDTDEYDTRPVRVYFILLAILFTGVLLRPFFGWVI